MDSTVGVACDRLHNVSINCSGNGRARRRSRAYLADYAQRHTPAMSSVAWDIRNFIRGSRFVLTRERARGCALVCFCDVEAISAGGKLWRGDRENT